MVSFRLEREEVEAEMSKAILISRKDFLKLFAVEYHQGQHVTLLGPSGRGKTKLGGQMLVAVLRKQPNIEGRVLHGKIKGRDKTIEELSRRGFPMTDASRLSNFQKYRYDWLHGKKAKRLGYIVRPLTRPMGSPDSKEDLTERENKFLQSVFRRTIYSSYHAKAKYPVILFVDEAHQAHNDLKLRKDCEGPLMRGRPVCGVWSLVQRGRYVSYMCYDQAEWVIIFFDPDRSNQERYSEIGGVDPNVLKQLSQNLETKTVADGSTISQCLCFRRSGSQLYIVDF